MVWVGFRVHGLGFRVLGLVSGLGFKVQGKQPYEDEVTTI
jgi:hypothetical protein